MSIGFKLTTKCTSVTTFHKLLDVVAKRHRASVSHEEETSELTICRLGTIFFDYEATDDEVLVSGYCQTNLLGAGFHKAAIELIDEVVDLNGFPFEIEDDTEYYEHRNFEEMRSEHFYSWLSQVINHCRERMGDETKMPAVCWDYNKYIPQEVEGTVISPFGRINLQHFTECEERLGIEAVAREFFMWNNEERDALFYRNAALSALWEVCYFMPSALPGYVCDYSIGYRKGEVTHRLGNLSFRLPGNFLYFEQEKSSGYYDTDEEAWHVVRTAAFSIREDEINYLEDEEHVLVEQLDALLEKMDDVSALVDINRRNVCAG